MNGFINKVCVKWQKEIDNKILGEIKQKAIENGIKTEYLLNEKSIINALEKQIPKKPNKIKWDYTCPCCNADEFYLIYDCQKDGKYNYCAKCGQALDWSDTE